MAMTDPRIGTELAGYRIESQLGRGGMSVVYLAEDLRLKRRAALKVLAPELAADQSFRQRFIAESELAASLDHPNVIPIFEAGEAEGVLFIAMRYVKSTDLKALIEREGRLDPDRALSIVGQTASALDTAHSQGLVHRDVKPANILVAEGQGSQGRDHVYLADFGLTKRAQQRTGLTRTGQFVGTVDYVAPEQIEGKEIDGRTDEYALACVLFECLTGESPFPKDDETAVLIAHLMDPVPSVRVVRPDLPQALDDVLRAGMAKQKEQRFPDCASFVRAAADAVAGRRAVTQFAAPPTPSPAAFEAPPGGVTSPGSSQPAPAATGGFQPAQAPAEFQPAPATGGFQPAPAETFRPGGDGGGRPPARRRRRLTTMVVSAVVAAGVAAGLVVLLNSGGDGNAEPTQGPSGPVTTGIAPTAKAFPAGTVIYADDFHDNSGKWDETSQGGFHIGLRGGRYFEEIKRTSTPQVFAPAFPGLPELAVLGDVRVAVTATKVAGTGPNGFGLACRTNGDTLSYYLVVSTTGGWAIEKSDGQNQPVLLQGTSPFIRKGERAGNVIEGSCAGGVGNTPVTLTLFVNGNQLGSVQDTPDIDVQGDSPGVYPTGTVGLVTVGNLGLRVEFDDFSIRAV